MKTHDQNRFYLGMTGTSLFWSRFWKEKTLVPGPGEKNLLVPIPARRNCRSPSQCRSEKNLGLGPSEKQNLGPGPLCPSLILLLFTSYRREYLLFRELECL